ncbi:MAG: DUF211 domain-containing protein [Caldisphaera sp.]|nr:DUF211 domain-containing protein [Caldisphaera sp.]PMP60755.1 MAG: hypothetical protein C0201_01805 [Caldisphaera sp.]PMP91414.1 MAG: hypothetical protein C0171_02625 [Caldisphaera sp.]
MSAPLRRIVLDVMKPIKGPSIIDVAKSIASIDGIEGVNITVEEMDVETAGLNITIEGNDIPFEKVEDMLENLGCVIHSIDQVISGKRIVEEKNLED